VKSFIKVFVLLVVLSGCATTVSQRTTPSPQQTTVDFQLFYDELSPYGTWVDYPNYGYVWMPDAGAGFTPYATAGRWVFTDDGWTWVSDYSWGWAPFHYGRWDYDSMYGWFWVPGNEWGPAWVSWRRAPGYYGWAPLSPGISVDLALNGGYRERDDRWIFVRDMDITNPDIRHHYLDRHNSVVIINNSTVIINSARDHRRNAVYIAGPDRGDVERVTRTRVDPVVIREDNRPGHRLSGNELQIYRPQIENRTRNGQRPAPQRVMRLNDVRPETERNGSIRQREALPPPTQNPTRTDQPARPPVQTTPPAQTTPPPTRQRDVTPPAGNTQQPVPPPAVTPPDNGRRPPRQREMTPAQRNRREQQPGVANPPNQKGKEKQPQNVAPSKRTRSAQPPNKKTQEEKEKRKREE
jgi:hypothetical protein